MTPADEPRSLAVRLIEATTRQPFADSIRARREKGMSYREIGAEFGLSWMTIWRHYREHDDTQSHERATTACDPTSLRRVHRPHGEKRGAPAGRRPAGPSAALADQRPRREASHG